MPSISVGNNKTWLDQADKVILEVNHWQPRELEGFHDIYCGTALPPHRRPMSSPSRMQRIGEPYLQVDPAKVVAVVETDSPDRNAPFYAPGEISRDRRPPAGLPAPRGRGAGSAKLLPLQSGVGNMANAVLAGLDGSEFTGLMAYTEVLQDGMLDLLDSGTLRAASATSFGLSGDGVAVQRRHRLLQGPHPAAQRGDLQPPRARPPARRHRDERDDRGRHLRQRQLHPRHGQRDHERHRRQRRLRPQRLPATSSCRPRPPRTARSRRSCRWSATSTTPSTTST